MNRAEREKHVFVFVFPHHIWLKLALATWFGGTD
jgi:hypothetical protein